MDIRDQKRRGFTILELLVVIAIIAVLVGISAPIIIRQLEKGREARVLQQMRDLETALFDYQNDNHGIYPVFSGFTVGAMDQTFTSDKDQGIYLIAVLRGASGDSEGGSALDNPEGKQYIEIKETTAEDGEGVVADSGVLLDSWKRPYHFIIDGTDDGDEITVDPFIAPFNTELEDKRVSERLVIFSLGRRMEGSGTAARYPNAIASWE